jgi:hypothetical protein
MFVCFFNLLMIFFVSFRFVSFLLYLVSFLLCLVSFRFVSAYFVSAPLVAPIRLLMKINLMKSREQGKNRIDHGKQNVPPTVTCFIQKMYAPPPLLFLTSR